MNVSRKTITVSEQTFGELDQQRDGRTWDAFLSQLMDETTTEATREVVGARITDSQYTELFGMVDSLPTDVAQELGQ